MLIETSHSYPSKNCGTSVLSFWTCEALLFRWFPDSYSFTWIQFWTFLSTVQHKAAHNRPPPSNFSSSSLRIPPSWMKWTPWTICVYMNSILVTATVLILCLVSTANSFLCPFSPVLQLNTISTGTVERDEQAVKKMMKFLNVEKTYWERCHLAD